jgi:hypothetical protein
MADDQAPLGVTKDAVLVGRYRDDAGADRYRKQRMEPDIAETRHLGIDYMPVVFPGFSWWNLMSFRKEAEQRRAASNAVPRRCGRFYWRQVVNAVEAGATMLYGAMFDEVDEGTAMFKIVADQRDLPPDPPFVSLDADGCALPSDWYLQLAGKASTLLRGEMKPSAEMPLPAAIRGK